MENIEFIPRKVLEDLLHNWYLGGSGCIFYFYEYKDKLPALKFLLLKYFLIAEKYNKMKQVSRV